MDLISRVANEKDSQETINAILAELRSRMDLVKANIEDIQPGQGAEICGLLFEMLAAAHGRTENDILIKQAKKALNGLIDATKPALEDTQPDQCSKLYKLLAGAEFTIATRHSVARRHQELPDIEE